MRKLAMNEFSTKKWSFPEDVHNYSVAGYKGIGVVRDKIEAYGIDKGVKLIKDSKLEVTELCVAGWFTEPEPLLSDRIKKTFEAIEIASHLESHALIIVAGPQGSLEYSEALKLLYEGLNRVIPYAIQKNIKLALEPIHPMYCSDYSFLSTLSEVLDVCDSIGSSNLGVWLDTYHLWWDNRFFQDIHRAKGRIFGVHVNDFKKNTCSLQDQGIPGEGIIPLKRMLSVIEEVGWSGIYTVEVFCDSTQKKDYKILLDKAMKGFNSIWDLNNNY